MIVRGKVDSRNGRVSIVADSVQNYVEGVVVLEDTSSVHYRYRNGGAPQGPNITPRKPNSAAQRPAPAAPVYVAPPAMADDDDGPYFDEASPFANDEPEWMMETGAPYDPTPPSPAQKETRAEVTPNPAPAPSAPRAQAEEKTTPTVAQVAPIMPPPTLPVEPLEFRKRTARIVFKRSRSLDADRKRLYELVQTLSGFEGDDNFEIVVESNGSEKYQLDFPNNRTKICRELTNLLDQRVGPGAWTIHPGRQESSA